MSPRADRPPGSDKLTKDLMGLGGSGQITAESLGRAMLDSVRENSQRAMEEQREERVKDWEKKMKTRL